MLEIFDGCEFAFDRTGENTLTITVERDSDTVGVGVDISPNSRYGLFEDLTVREIFIDVREVIEVLAKHAKCEWEDSEGPVDSVKYKLLLLMLGVGEEIARDYAEERNKAIKEGDFSRALEIENHLFDFHTEGHEKLAKLLEAEALNQLFEELDIDTGVLGDFLKGLEV